MSATASPQIRQDFPPSFKRTSTTYALAIDVAGEDDNAYQEIRRILARHGFSWQ
jgi:hypothetical protein